MHPAELLEPYGGIDPRVTTATPGIAWLQRIQEHFDRAVSLEELARAVGMSPRNLIRRFKAATGRVPGDYVQTLRVAAARELLERGGGVSIQEVCSQVGYEDLAFFRHLFKRHTGLSPAEYRSRFAGMSVEREDREPS